MHRILVNLLLVLASLLAPRVLALTPVAPVASTTQLWDGFQGLRGRTP